MPEFMVVLRGNDPGLRAKSPTEQTRLMAAYVAWVEKLRTEKRYRGGSPFKPGTKRLTGYKDLVMIMDAASGKNGDALSGYFVIEARAFSEALEIAKTCPALGAGKSVEVVELDN